MKYKFIKILTAKYQDIKINHIYFLYKDIDNGYYDFIVSSFRDKGEGFEQCLTLQKLNDLGIKYEIIEK